MPSFSLKSLKQSIGRHDDLKIDPATKIPLTERNIQFFNKRDVSKEEESEEDGDPVQSKKNARDKVQRSREVQVSEWLRLLPRVCHYLDPHR